MGKPEMVDNLFEFGGGIVDSFRNIHAPGN
jgi:hypothetical protein